MHLLKSWTILMMLTSVCLGQIGARYLIITHDDYSQALQPLAQWKTQKGLKTMIVPLSLIGNDSTEIRNYILNAYNTWTITPEYVLLVGNPDQLPFPRYDYSGNIGNTDNYYADMTGDFHNEIIPGRFYVFDTLEVQTIVSKVLSYDKAPSAQSRLWLKKGTTIVNEDQDPLPADSVYYADARYMHVLMNNAGFSHIDSFSEYAGHDSADVIAAINEGRSYIMYRGVAWSIWDWPFWGIYPALMHNGQKLPIVISATCQTVQGIGYEWLNAGTPEEPKGTVGFFGTTTGLYNAAEFRSALARGTLQSIFCDSLSTLGIAAEQGRLNYYALYGNILEYNSWTCLGDPEMTVRTTTPRRIDVAHDSVLWVSNDSSIVNINVQYNELPVENALVCMMSRGDSNIYHYGRTDVSGDIQFVDTFEIPGDSISITVTGRNLLPYNKIIRVNLSGAPFVVLDSFILLDTPGGNDDNIANPGEDIEIPVKLKNWGDSTAYNVKGIIQEPSPDSFVTLYDTIKFFGDINGLDSVFSPSDGYNIVVAANCPDTHHLFFDLVVTDDNDSSWISELNFTVHAPILTYWDYHFPSSVKYTEAGDTNQLVVDISNIGSYRAENAVGKIFSNDSFFIQVDSISSFGTIDPNTTGSNQADPFVITTSPLTPPCYPIDLMLEITSGVYIDTLYFVVYAGQKDYLVFDKDPVGSSGPVIDATLDSLEFYGDYCDTLPTDDFLSLYKAIFICLGTYPNNYIITDTNQIGQEIERYLSILDGKVYLEGGDVWYADPHYYHGYQFHTMFSLFPIANSIGPLYSVSGKDSTFTESMSFGYSGGTNSLDRIDPDSPGFRIFEKPENTFGCGVAANNRTVGISFELGGLVDGSEPSTKRTLIDSIMAYFGILPTGIPEFQRRSISPVMTLTVFPNPSRKTVNMTIQGGINIRNITLYIYDISGRLVRDFKLPASCSLLPTYISWDGTDMNNRKVAQGIYFIHLRADSQTITHKTIFLR